MPQLQTVNALVCLTHEQVSNPLFAGNSIYGTSICSAFIGQGDTTVVLVPNLADPATLQAMQRLVATPDQYAGVPFDYTAAASALAFGFSVVLTFYILAKPIGAMIDLVRRS